MDYFLMQVSINVADQNALITSKLKSMVIFTRCLMMLLTAIGVFLFCNGLFHGVLYLFDEAPLMSGFRYVNWISLFLGVLLLSYGISGLKTRAFRRDLY